MGLNEYATFAAEHRRNLPGGEVSFWRDGRAATEKEATYAYVQTWLLGRGLSDRVEIKLDDAGKSMLKRIEYALSDAFEAGKRAQQKATLEVLGVKQ